MDSNERKLKFSETRTIDVVTDKSFKQLLLDDKLIKRMKSVGFHDPTPVQAGAIPVGLLGNDLLVQAKSGTGKTLVFAVLAANCVTETSARGKPQVVILAPTHEIAVQIKDTIEKVAFDDPHICLFIGGMPIRADKEGISRGCDVAVGTPGRIAQLSALKVLDLSNTKLLVLDEADKLMDSIFTEDIKRVYRCVNAETTQVAVFSATYPMLMDEMLCDLMKSPILVKLSSDNVQLVGIYQYALIVLGEDPIDVVDKLLRMVNYGQAVVFTNNVGLCQKVSERLIKSKHKAQSISGDLSQEERTKVFNNWINNRLKVLVSTDLTARGVDAANVSLVINMGPPLDQETYFHRIGRAGRFGGNGAGITVINSKSSLASFLKMSEKGKFNIRVLRFDDTIPINLVNNQTFFEKSRVFNETISDEIDMAKDGTWKNDEADVFDMKALEEYIPLDIFAKKNMQKNQDDAHSILNNVTVGKLEQNTSNSSTKIEESKEIQDVKQEKKDLENKFSNLQQKSFGKSTNFGGKSGLFIKKVAKKDDVKTENESSEKNRAENEVIKPVVPENKVDDSVKIQAELSENVNRPKYLDEFRVKVNELDKLLGDLKIIGNSSNFGKSTALFTTPKEEPEAVKGNSSADSIVHNLRDKQPVSERIIEKIFENKSCQVELLKQPTIDQECQTEVLTLEEQNLDDFSEFEESDVESDGENEPHIFNTFADALIERMKLYG